MSAVPSRTPTPLKDPQAEADWDRELGRYPVHTPFQRAGWTAAKAGAGYEQVFLSGAGYHLAGLVTHSAGGPVLTCTRGPAYADETALRTATKDIRTSFPEHEVRIGPYAEGTPAVRTAEHVLREAGWRPVGTQFHRMTATVALGSDEAMAARMSHGTRYTLKKADRAGVRVSARADEAAARRFAGCYADFAHRNGYRSLPNAYLEKLGAWFRRTGTGTYLFLTVGDELRSAALLLTAGRLGWVSRAPTTGSEPYGAVLFWESLRWLRDRGCTHCDLGGIHSDETGRAVLNGLTKFKLSLGAHLVPIVDEHVLYRRYHEGP
ncbi:GNAT family N-acetyltransferase [Streptomyces lunalinharesii]|uniref:BioF2-like acetyltransferase domain-containing protein n=1 Tax=Streptomyces lunalinharesii TaxID=333384 RepID=A0ABP6EY48_9ACTN